MTCARSFIPLCMLQILQRGEGERGRQRKFRELALKSDMDLLKAFHAFQPFSPYHFTSLARSKVHVRRYSSPLHRLRVSEAFPN